MSTATIPEHLGDLIELELLVSGLGRFLDELDGERAAELFTEDVVVSTPGGVAAGREAVVAQALRSHEVPTQHLITNVISEIDGDSARMTANLLVVFAGGPVAAIGPRRIEVATVRSALGERYRFEAVRASGGWRLRRIEVDAVWSVAPAPPAASAS